MPEGAALRLDGTLVIDVSVPIAHRVFILVPDDKVVDDTWITFPENLDAIESCPLGSENTAPLAMVSIENGHHSPGF